MPCLFISFVFVLYLHVHALYVKSDLLISCALCLHVHLHQPPPGVVLRGLGASASRMACTRYSTSTTSSLLVSRLGTTPARITNKQTNKQHALSDVTRL